MPWFDDLLGRLAKPPVGRSRRISSNEQPDWNDSNFDLTRLPPGSSFELPVLRGPGIINHLWLTSHAGAVGELNALTLRVYWDGRDTPGVEVPLGSFFAVGDGPLATVESLPVQVSPSGSLSCYWRMPFRHSARLTVTNDNPDRSTGLYWQVDWVQLDDLPPDTAYFHARYRQEYPAVAGRDYLLFEGAGRGCYVGTVLGVTLAQDGWFGEGDECFVIDGETIPSLQGTGTEDYFNDAWGFRPRTSLWFGQPRVEGWSAGDDATCYRWHVLDPVLFGSSLRVALEHKGNQPASEDGWFLERPDYFASVAFWYQVGEPAPFGDLPPWPERRVPWQTHHLLRSLRAATVTAGPPPTFALEGMFGARPALAWPAPPAGAVLDLPVITTARGRQTWRVVAFAGPGCGTFDVLLDGEVGAAGVHLGGSPREERVSLGERSLAPGPHRLGFGAHGDGGLVVESCQALALPPLATRDVKSLNEGHFIQLGIGRAVYAYRLVEGRLPAGLAELVESGFMEARYLRDENGVVLVDERRADALWVTAPGWARGWAGLDARR